MKFKTGDIVYIGNNTEKSSLINEYHNTFATVIGEESNFLPGCFLVELFNGEKFLVHSTEVVPKEIYESPLFKAMNEEN